MALSILDNLKSALLADAGVYALVDGQIDNFTRTHEMEALLKVAPYKSFISCEMANMAGEKNATDPILIAHIFSRNGDDGGAYYCAEIANAVKALLDDGFTGTAVESMVGSVYFNPEAIAYACKLQIRCHVKATYTLTLACSHTSPQEYGDEIVFVADCSPAEGVQYRFLLSGPGTGSAWRDMTGWQGRNAFAWRTGEKDVGTNAIKVQVRAGTQISGQTDQESSSTEFVITAPDSTPGSAPTITSLTPNLASPQAEATQIDFICIAADADAEAIYYQFYLTGPGTASKKKMVQPWSKRNSWTWKPGSVDVGASTIEVQVRDGLHAAEGSYDANTTASYTITAAPGGASNAAPTITSLTPNLASPQVEATQIDFICIAADEDTDRLFYRFFLTGPGTASKKKLVQDWGRKNYWTWTPESVDVGASTIEVQIRDGLHAAEGSYDANTTASYTITAAPGGASNAAPTITSLTPSLASPRGQGTQIDFICIAADADSDKILYKFLLTGPGTASKKVLVQDWSAKNSWSWTPDSEDIGSNTIEVQVRDGNHAEEGSYDANTTASFTVSSNTAPAIAATDGVYKVEAQDIYVGDPVHVVCSATDTDGDKIYYRWFLYRETIGADRELLADWTTQNWIKYTPDESDYESVTFYCQVRDGKHAGEESYDDEDSLTITINRASITSVTPSLASPQANENTITFSCLATKTANLNYRWWLKGPGTGNAWVDQTGWTEKNSWTWRTMACDIGTNYIRCEVVDNKSAWDDDDVTDRQLDTTYTIS